jgi:hypothetical protein
MNGLLLQPSLKHGFKWRGDTYHGWLQTSYITRFDIISRKLFSCHPKKLVKAFSNSVIELSVIPTTKECLPIPGKSALSLPGARISVALLEITRNH